MSYTGTADTVPVEETVPE